MPEAHQWVQERVADARIPMLPCIQFFMALNLEQKGAPPADPALARYVERDPARLGGVPVFRGTRVPVKSLFDHLQAGDSLETFLDDFPGVSREEALGVLDLAARHLLAEMGAP